MNPERKEELGVCHLSLAVILHYLVLPVSWIAQRMHVNRLTCNKSRTKILLGILITLAGAFLYRYPLAPAWCPDFFWDAFANSLQGYGALPIVKVACRWLDLEQL